MPIDRQPVPNAPAVPTTAAADPTSRRQPVPAARIAAARLVRVGALVLSMLPAIAAPIDACAQSSRSAPEAASGYRARSLATATHHMVAAANPLAVDAGLEILDAGGTAVDAAIAVQLVLGLVEPQSSGLGGGAFLLHRDGRTRLIAGYDGRETAPAAAGPDRFLRDGRPLPFARAAKTGLSVGAPGVARLLGTVHRAHGRLPWARLFEPAIRLATDGFVVSPRLAALVAAHGREGFDASARAYFFPDKNTPIAVGQLLRNPAYAATLRRIATDGDDAFYSGEIAAAIVRAVAAAPTAPGDLTLADLAKYAVVARPPVCTAYRGRRVCGMGPPSSGGIAVAQSLALLEPFDLGRGRAAAMNPRALHLIAEAEKLAYADRDRYVADPLFAAPPTGLLDASYLARRRSLIGPTAMPRPPAGEPTSTVRGQFGDDHTVEAAGTSHISIIDGEGNAVAMTTTIEAAFGSGLMAAGFLLNNQLTDFSFRATDAVGQPVANRIEPGKRPRSSMAPTLVLDADGELLAVLGSPGGSRIILYVVKALVALVDWRLDAREAAALPNFGSRGVGIELEAEPAATAAGTGAFRLLSFGDPTGGGLMPWHALHMTAFGHAVRLETMTSGLHIITARGHRLEGGADPRREGVAKGR